MTGLETGSLAVCRDTKGSTRRSTDQKVTAAKTQKTVIKVTSLPIDIPTLASKSPAQIKARITENHKLLKGANSIGP